MAPNQALEANWLQIKPLAAQMLPNQAVQARKYKSFPIKSWNNPPTHRVRACRGVNLYTSLS